METNEIIDESEVSINLAEQQVMEELKLLKYSAEDFPSSAKGLTFSAVIEYWCYHFWNEIDPKTLNKKKIFSFWHEILHGPNFGKLIGNYSLSMQFF